MRNSLVAVCLFISSIEAYAAQPALQVSVQERTVTISNATRRGSVVLFSCSRTGESRSILVAPSMTVLRDEDADSVVRYTALKTIPIRSVWVAVDEESGDIAYGAPSGFPIDVKTLSTSDFRKDVEGEIEALAIERPRLVTLLVRPGTGAWRETVFDNEPNDKDGSHNGRVQLSFEDSTAIDGKQKAPKHLKRDDVVVAIDPGHLEIFVAQVGK